MNLLDLTPVPTARVSEQGDRVTVLRPKPSPRGLLTPFDWLVYLLAPRRLRLDEVGSFFWRHMDGRRTAGDIAAALRAEFGAPVEPAEERLGQFIHMLQREELVSFLDLDG